MLNIRFFLDDDIKDITGYELKILESIKPYNIQNWKRVMDKEKYKWDS